MNLFLIKYLKLVLTVLVLLSLIPEVNSQVKTSKPNIVLILSDDAGYADFSFQSNRLIPTPNIDFIAKEGVKFTDAYVTGAVCSPSRAGILTGVNQATFGHVINFVQNVKYTIPLNSLGLPTNQKLIGEYLKPCGYTTGIVGKWHEGFSERFHPNNRGFDYFWGFLWGSSPYYAGQAKLVEENNSHIPAENIPYMTDAIGDKSLEFIEKNAQNPFFLYVSFNAPHTPMQAKPEVLKKYEDKFSPKGRALNAAMTESLDENVGRILEKLKKLNLLDNTLVIFTNDNGGQIVESFADNYPLKGRKGEIYEGGIRVPMAIMWKGKIKPGIVSEVPVTTLDFLPTFINAAGGKASQFPKLEGKDLMTILNAKSSKKLLKRDFYWDIGYGQGAIRSGDWKMSFFRDQPAELHNLKNDISEKNDLAKQQPAIAKNLTDKFLAWKKKLPPQAWTALGKEKESDD
ncbi:sulfatase [Pedobacter psychrophilus]|uniref:sulfatase n=1 Tax=Pedobacter psychrophilus TaxID=1826909 RepID=UPI0018DF395A|nr:sulfatase [Pedobacter psychrophilus]